MDHHLSRWGDEPANAGTIQNLAIRGSITCLGNRLRELENTREQPTTLAHAQQLHGKLMDLDSNFRDLHMQVVGLIEEISKRSKLSSTIMMTMSPIGLQEGPRSPLSMMVL